MRAIALPACSNAEHAGKEAIVITKGPVDTVLDWNQGCASKGSHEAGFCHPTATDRLGTYTMRTSRFFAAAVLAAGTSVAAVAAGASPTLVTLQTFKGLLPAGSYVMFSGVIENNGLLYGSNSFGGTNKSGTLYSVDPVKRVENALYNFSNNQGAMGELTFYNGNFYGMTQATNTGLQAQNLGSLFEFNPATGSETVLYQFPENSGGGYLFKGRLIECGSGTFCGVTPNGGDEGAGTVYKIDLATGAETDLYHFQGGKDGQNPNGPLLYINGLLYGTTEFGGSSGYGIVFAIDPTTGVETILHSFIGGNDESDSQTLIYNDGTLYGTDSGADSLGQGSLYAIDPVSGNLTVLYSFAGGADGSGPVGLAYVNGMLYGTTLAGGASGLGTVFEFNLATGGKTTLHDFTGKRDGSYPREVMVNNGVLYGTACNCGTGYVGGEYVGTVYKMIP